MSLRFSFTRFGALGSLRRTTPSATTIPNNRIRNAANTGYVLSLTGGYATFGVPSHG